jgi:hypothetical protein
MVEVFKTNVRRRSQAKSLLALLRQYFPDSRINFDLDDCDKILRVQGEGCCPTKIAQLFTENGFECCLLD